MSLEFRFIELNPALHDRSSFDCGEAELNAFLRTRAAKHMEVGISRTLVLPDPAPLAGGQHSLRAFYTIAPSSILRQTLPSGIGNKLPSYPVPVFLLAQLAVDTRCQGQGLGKITLLKAFAHLWEIHSHMRAFAIIVDCLNASSESFYQQYGFEILCRHQGRTRMFIAMATVGQLFP